MKVVTLTAYEGGIRSLPPAATIDLLRKHFIKKRFHVRFDGTDLEVKARRGDDILMFRVIEVQD